MKFEKDDEKSSGTAVLKNRYATTFEGANIQTLILGEGVFERVDKRPEEVLYPHRERAAARTETMKDEFIITRETIGRCILVVQKYFWGKCCYAILYCVLRDKFGYDKKMKHFEDYINKMSKELHFDYICTKNTLSSAFNRNKYLKLNVDKWSKRGVKQRNIDLADDFYDAINGKN